MFFNLPTLLTWARIVAIPLIVGVFYLDLAPAQRNLLATVLFVVVALTDWADGWLARRLNMTSSFGAFLDPVADKFLVCAALLVLVHEQRLHSLVGPDLFAERADEWRLGVTAVREHPWFGRPAAPNPYNLTLDLAAKSGLPALLLFAWLVASSLASGIRATAGSDATSPLALGLFGAAVAMLVTGVGESTLGARMTPTVFATLGLLAGIGARGRQAGT